jgi:hypothetical protein
MCVLSRGPLPTHIVPVFLLLGLGGDESVDLELTSPQPAAPPYRRVWPSKALDTSGTQLSCEVLLLPLLQVRRCRKGSGL